MLINKFDFLYTISVDKVNGAPQLLPEHLLWRIVGLTEQKQVAIIVSVQSLHFLQNFLFEVNDASSDVIDGVLQAMNDYHLRR